MTDQPGQPVGGMTFPRGAPGPPDPHPVPTIPAELLAWGAGVRTDLAAIDKHLELIFKLLQDQRDLLLHIAGNAGASVLLAKAEREDAQQ